MGFASKDRERLEQIKWNWINQRMLPYADTEWLIAACIKALEITPETPHVHPQRPDLPEVLQGDSSEGWYYYKRGKWTRHSGVETGAMHPEYWRGYNAALDEWELRESRAAAPTVPYPDVPATDVPYYGNTPLPNCVGDVERVEELSEAAINPTTPSPGHMEGCPCHRCRTSRENSRP